MFARGFKTWCEKAAAQHRRDLGLQPRDPLDSVTLAESLGIEVHSLDEVPALDPEARQVLLADSSGWSAVTLTNGRKSVVILNSAHSAARSASDLMHELAHILIGHKAGRIDITEDGTLVLNTYDRSQEDEANWLAGCLLLPREALLWILQQRLEPETAAQRYGASVAMFTYRVNVTGVKQQARFRSARR
jgi:Zn-dependent peptidase ImmA (M78 family)